MAATALAALPDGRAIFVPFVLPGEQVSVEIVEEKKRFAKGRAVSIVKASPDRIEPRCGHFEICGGCQYQHLDYAKQLEVKQAIMLDQLQRIAGIENPPLQPIVPSPSPWNYRNYVQFHLGQQGELGYIAVDGKHLLPISECHLPLDGIGTLWPQIELGEESGVYRLGMRQDSYDEIMLIMEGEDPKPPEFSEDIPRLSRLCPSRFPADRAGRRRSSGFQASGTQFPGLSALLLPGQRPHRRDDGPARPRQPGFLRRTQRPGTLRRGLACSAPSSPPVCNT